MSKQNDYIAIPFEACFAWGGGEGKVVRASKDLWRLAISCTLWGDLFNRPVCGFVRLRNMRE